MKDKEIKENIAKGHLLCRVIFEMAGNPKEHVEQTLKQYISAIKEDPSYVFINEDYVPCEETSQGVWSTFLEADVLIAGFEKLSSLCINLSPASVEIIEPEEFNFNSKKLTDIYGDFISKIHEVGASVKNLNGENELLKININRLIRNCITLTLSESKTAEEIGLKAGIDVEHLRPFLDAMVKEKTIFVNDNVYTLKRP